MSDEIAVKNATVAKFKAIAAQYGANETEIKRLQAWNVDLSAQARKCHDTANLFGFDLLVELAARADNSPQMFSPSEAPVPVLPPATRGPTIREIILELAEQAWPEPVRAADLRQKLLERGIQTHEKTVGMTLYRLFKDEDAVRRRGKANWFFVPLSERQPVPEKETPGDQPGGVEMDQK